MKISGIYKIVNRINGKYYVGSSKDIDKRWHYHKVFLNNNYHPNDYLQHSWNKNKEENFELIIVERLEPNREILHKEENKYLFTAKNEKDKTYNLNFDAQGGDISEYSRKKISDKNKGKNCFSYGEELSNQVRQKISASRKGIFVGKNSPRYNHNIYSFINTKTNEKFIGTCYDFTIKYNLLRSSVYRLISKIRKNTKNWRLLN